MAYQTQDIGQYLKRRASGQGVVTASDVAVTYDENTGAMSESLKDRLDKLVLSDSATLKDEIAKLQVKITTDSKLDASLIKYITKDSVETTVKDYLDNLLLSVSNSSQLPFTKEDNPGDGTLGKYLKEFETIDASKVTYQDTNAQMSLYNVLSSLNNYETSCSDSAASAKDSATQALKYSYDAKTSESNIESSKELLNTIKTQYSNISNIANDLQASLNVSGATIRVLTEEAYNQLSSDQMQDGTIYMLYNTNENDHYAIIGVSANTVMGSVTGSDTHAYLNTQVKLVPVPNTGYVFEKWMNSKDSTSNTTNPLIVTAAEDIIYTAHFKADTNESTT